MADSMQLVEVGRAIDLLGARVGDARATFGDIPAVQRLVNDIERLRIDARELGDVASVVPPQQAPRPPTGPKITIDNTPVDPAMWADADDEGIGGFHGTAR
jgi:hypothetical protein